MAQLDFGAGRVRGTFQVPGSFLAVINAALDWLVQAEPSDGEPVQGPVTNHTRREAGYLSDLGIATDF